MKQTSAHVVSVASGSSASGEKIVADIGATSGVESITQGRAALSVKVTPTFAYVKGNASGLTAIFGFSSADAKKVGKDWVSWKAGTRQYSDLKSDVTVSSVLDVLPKVHGTRMSTRVIKGVKYYDLVWSTPATGSIPELSNTLTVWANGTYLPFEEVSSASAAAKVSTVFSDWGEPVLVNAPPVDSTIPVAKVTG